MKNILILCFVLSTFFKIYAQDNYSSSYKYITLKSSKDLNQEDQLSQGFLETIVYDFFSNKNACYLANTSTIETVGVNAKISGEQNIFINYNNKNVSYNLNESSCEKFKIIKFRRVEITSKVIIMGYTTSKYVSEDNNLILYTTKNLPWFIQPCLFNFNQINECVLRFENVKKKYGLELIKVNKFQSDSDFDFTLRKISEKKCNNEINQIVCPFFSF